MIKKNGGKKEWLAIRIADCDVYIRNAYDAHILFSVNAGKLYR